MTVEQQVRDAKTPKAALIILARAIDALQSEPTVDSWRGWDEQGDTAVDRSDEPKVAPPRPARKYTDDEVIAWFVKSYGRAPEDNPEGRAALQQLKVDLENAPNEPQTHYEFHQTEDGVIESDIDWSPLSEKHHAARYAFAKGVLNLDVALGPHPEQGDWAEDYARGGPFWLTIPNRDLVMQYPEGVRAQMVADVALYGNQKVTRELSGDILKRPMSTDMAGGAPRPAGFEPEQLL